MAAAVTLATGALPAGGQSQRAEIRLAALTAAAAADALDDLQAVDDPDAAGVRTAFRNATRQALEAASKAYDSAPAFTATVFDLSLEAAEAAERFGDALARALEARGELEAVVPEAAQTRSALDAARRADSIFRAAKIAREAVLAELSCHQSDGCPPPSVTTSHDSAPTNLITASWLAVRAAEIGNVAAAQAAHAAVLAEVAADQAAADAARADVLVALGVSPEVARAALDSYLALDAESGTRCSFAAEVVLPARGVRTALVGSEGEELGNSVLHNWESFRCSDRIYAAADSARKEARERIEAEEDQRRTERCHQARASGDRVGILMDCPRDRSNLEDELEQERLEWEAKRDRDRKARDRQGRVDSAQTLRLATVETLLDAQSGVGDLGGTIEVLAEGASVAGDRSVEATVSAASAVREAETYLDEAISAYRRTAAAWRALLEH